MATFRISAPKQGPSPARTFTWNGAVRAGEDLKVAFTMLDADGETPLRLVDPLGVLSLFPIDPSPRPHGDYGLGWLTCRSRPVLSVNSVQIAADIGRLNFWVTAAQTAQLHGPLGLLIAVDDYDGANCQVEGVLQVRPGLVPHDRPRIYFQPGITPIGIGIIPGRVINNVPVDADGFPLLAMPYVHPTGSGGAGGQIDYGALGVLGRGVLGRMILGLGGAQ